MNHGGRFALTAFAIGILSIGSIFVAGFVARDILIKAGLLPTVSQFEPLFTIMDIMLWIAVLVLSLVSAIRAQPTRLADLSVAALSAVAVYELGESLWRGIVLMRMLDSYDLPLPSLWTISQAELEALNGVALVWLFRTLLSRAFVKAYVSLRSATARTARELSDTRPERPILFLRSFADDEQLVPSSDTFLAYAFGAVRPRVRLEEIVADIMFAKGPLVALADPGVGASPIGAARDVATHDGWQRAILAYLDRSQINVCFFGRTRSFLWEIDQILDRGRLSSTLIVFPPSYPNDRQLVHDAPRLAAMIGLRDEQDERARLAGARILVQDCVSGFCVVVISKGKGSFSYREAILDGAAIIQRNAAAQPLLMKPQLNNGPSTFLPTLGSQ